MIEYGVIMDKAKETILKYAPQILIPLLLFLIVNTLKTVGGELLLFALPQISKISLAKLLVLFGITILIESALFFHLLNKYINKLNPKYGILWDKNKNAFCPVCKTHMSTYEENYKPVYSDKGFPAFICNNCKEYFPLNTKTGKPITLKEIIKLN